jgi:hypothetical protein
LSPARTKVRAQKLQSSTSSTNAGRFA